METDCISHIFIGWILCQQGDPETDRKALVKNVFAAADMCGTALFVIHARTQTLLCLSSRSNESSSSSSSSNGSSWRTRADVGSAFPYTLSTAMYVYCSGNFTE
jgi:hypothetical protein